MLNTKLRQMEKSNRRLEESMTLAHEDKYLLQHMFSYLWHKNLNPYDKECLRTDLLGMAQEAHKRQQPLREAIGDDRTFCDNLVISCNKSRTSETICTGVSIWFIIIFAYYAWTMLTDFLFVVGFQIFAPSYSIIITADYIFGVTLMWPVFYVLWLKVIPLPYAFYKQSFVIVLLALLLWAMIYRGLVLHIAVYQEIFVGKEILLLRTPANLIFITSLFVGYVGFRYIAETLAYRQSSFAKQA